MWHVLSSYLHVSVVANQSDFVLRIDYVQDSLGAGINLLTVLKDIRGHDDLV